MKNLTFIYGLVDPRDNEIRYVGRAADPVDRLGIHKYKAKKVMDKIRDYGGVYYIGPTPKQWWIDSLMLMGLEPDIVLLDCCSAEDGHEVEQRWIKHLLDEGVYLTNTRVSGRSDLNADWKMFWDSVSVIKNRNNARAKRRKQVIKIIGLPANWVRPE